MLPQDQLGRGFDNMAEALTVTPALVQGYVRAASKISREALGDRDVAPAMTMYRVPKVVNQMRHVEGAPWGRAAAPPWCTRSRPTATTRSGWRSTTTTSRRCSGRACRKNLQGQQIEVAVDGARVALFTIDPSIPETKALLTTPPIRITAGPHRVAAAFLATFDGPTEDQFRPVEQSMIDISAGVPGLVALPHLLSMTVAGPHVGHRRVRHAQPPEDPQLRPGVGGRRDAVCAAHHRRARPPGLPPRR